MSLSKIAISNIPDSNIAVRNIDFRNIAVRSIAIRNIAVRNIAMGPKPNWKNSHSLPERLAALGIMGAQIRAPKYDIVLWCTGLLNFSPMVPRDASVSDGLPSVGEAAKVGKQFK